jgi:hypothetical protein
MAAASQYVSNAFTPFFDKVKGTVNSSNRGFFSGSSNSSIWSSLPSTSNSTISSVGQVATYVLAVLVIMLFILVVVHFFITPIFQLRPGGPGMIPVPGGDDGRIFWNKGSHPQILESQLPIAGKSWNYSLILDMFIQNPLQFSDKYRILFSRGAVRKTTAPTGSDTFLGMLDTYNLVVALKPDTNDLVVSVLSGSSTTKNEENAVISNVPVQKSFRLGIVVMENALEVYLNGNLVKTRKYDYNIQSVTGPIDSALPEQSTIALFPLLKVWNRILTTSEMRYAKPDLDVIAPLGALSMPSTSSCFTDALSNTPNVVSNASNAVQNATGATTERARNALGGF